MILKIIIKDKNKNTQQRGTSWVGEIYIYIYVQVTMIYIYHYVQGGGRLSPHLTPKPSIKTGRRNGCGRRSRPEGLGARRLATVVDRWRPLLTVGGR